VRINELNPLNYMPAGTTYDVSTNDNLGGFSLKGINFTRQHLEITAQGYYFNELTGAPADDFEPPRKSRRPVGLSQTATSVA
jgi:hypothetical protein